ncbi:MAG: aldehyde dehydrogenase family protein [Bradymonadia bacterium]
MDTRLIIESVERLRDTFNRGVTRPYQWRMEQLNQLQALVEENTDAILEALQADLGKPTFEAWGAEIGVTLKDIKETKRHLKTWMKPERVATALVTQPGSSRRYKDPLGCVLIIAPWNYPFNLVFAPLVGALAAGNTVLVKPSEVTENTSRLIAQLLPRYIDPSVVAVVEGGIPETTTLLEQRFDHIFYTGNGHVGRIVMTAAARHLTPVTLELGGKSPVYVHESADLKTTARRVAWGKFLNAGQTCIAPDYVLVDEAVRTAFLDELKAAVSSFYGDNPMEATSFARIVSDKHHARLSQLLENQNVFVGGVTDPDQRYISPTILIDVETHAPVMQAEIFGPILPVLSVRGVDEAVEFINGRPKPLALYIFTKQDEIAETVLSRTSSGGATVNHCMLHYAVPGLPFGGVGESGMGAYHGEATFDTFTHKKSVLKKPFAIDPSIMYPPYTASKEKWLKRLL